MSSPGPTRPPKSPNPPSSTQPPTRRIVALRNHRHASAPPLPTLTPTPPPPDLCAACSALDLEAALARAHHCYERSRRGFAARRLDTFASPSGVRYLRDFFFVASLGRRICSIFPPSCKLCRFLREHYFRNSTPSEAETDRKGTYKLLAICSSETYLFEAPRKDARGRWVKRAGWDVGADYWGEAAARGEGGLEWNVFLAVVPEVEGVPRTGVPLRWLEEELPKRGGVYRVTSKDKGGEERILVPRVVGEKAELERVMKWLKICRVRHRGCCAPKKAKGETMRWFKVIDCETREIKEVDWAEEKYVALSYVWDKDPVVQKWPPTVCDAVEATKLLGARYLWVDRLCIDQDSTEEKMYLVARMDKIYAGAEFTIVNAAGDAKTGLPGVGATPRNVQPAVKLACRAGAESIRTCDIPNDLGLDLLNVEADEYEKETEGHFAFLDTYRHGLNDINRIRIGDVLAGEDLPPHQRNQDFVVKSVCDDHKEPWVEDLERELGVDLPTFLMVMKKESRRRRVKMRDLVRPFIPPHVDLLVGFDDEPESDSSDDENPGDRRHAPESGSRSASRQHDDSDLVMHPNRPFKTLPPGLVPQTTWLVSTMQEPRTTIRQSEWATRGWTFQEGLLATRRLVFTKDQVYWECNGMVVHESILFPLDAFHMAYPPVTKPPQFVFADYMLSGIFSGDLHGTPELQYGYRIRGEEKKSERLRSLLGHIHTFTSRKLTNPSDSLNAFLGVAATYATSGGLCLLAGIPIWTGRFADPGATPGLQLTLAFALSIWVHWRAGEAADPKCAFHTVDCVRRPTHPSWSWAGWEGRADFDVDGNSAHTQFLSAGLEDTWAATVKRMWAAEMVLQTSDGRDSTLTTGMIPMESFAQDTQQKLLWLTIKAPVVLKARFLKHSMDQARIHLSVPLSRAAVTEGHEKGDMVSVLVYAGVVPFVWDGRARFLVLRKVDAAGKQWERIGRLVLTITEGTMARCGDEGQAILTALPIDKFGRDITII